MNNDYTQDYARIQGVIDTCNGMVAQIVANHPRKAHIAADLAAYVDEWLPFVEERGWRVTAGVLRSYYVFGNALVPAADTEPA